MTGDSDEDQVLPAARTVTGSEAAKEPSNDESGEVQVLLTAREILDRESAQEESDLTFWRRQPRVSYFWLRHRLTGDVVFSREAAEIIDRVEPTNSHSAAGSADELLNHWTFESELGVYERGQLVESVGTAIYLPDRNGDYTAAEHAVEQGWRIDRAEFIALLIRYGMTVPGFLQHDGHLEDGATRSLTKRSAPTEGEESTSEVAVASTGVRAELPEGGSHEGEPVPSTPPSITTGKKNAIEDKTDALVADADPKQEPVPIGNWKMRIQEEATRRWRRLRHAGCSPTKHALKDELARWCREEEVTTATTGVSPSAEYIYRHVLRDWTPPKGN